MSSTTAEDAFPQQVGPPEAFGRPDQQKEEGKDQKSDSKQRGQAGQKKDEKGNDEGNKKPPFYKRPVLMTVLIVIFLVVVVGGVLWWLHARQYESTDDAFIDGHVIPISPQVAALVSVLHIDDNWAVKRGDLLIELDSRDYDVVYRQRLATQQSAADKVDAAKAQLVVAQANVGQAAAQVLVARANAANAERDYQRFIALEPRARAQEQFDNAIAAQSSTAAQVQAALAQVAAAQAQVQNAQVQIQSAEDDLKQAIANTDQARINQGYCRIYAPEDGRITRKNVEPGIYVSPGQILFSIVPTDVWVTANFKETQLSLMRVGQPVDIEVDAFPGQEFHGVVNSIQNGSGAKFSLIPPENATGNYVKVVQRVPVKILFDPGETDDPAHLLAPGLSVEPDVKVR